MPCAASDLGNLSPRPIVMDAREMPTREMVIRDGQPVWRVCGMGICIETGSGTKAQAEFEALCRSKGIEPPTGPALPERGPSEVDEPGV
jgi:hypothetical protein